MIGGVSQLKSNAIGYHTYLTSGSIHAEIYDDWLELMPPGCLSPDLTVEQLIEGHSRVRNVAIGAAFQYMHIIEKWGSGIPRVYEEARAYGLGDPVIKNFGAAFRIEIKRKPFETDSLGVIDPTGKGKKKIGGQEKEMRDNVSQNVPQNVSQSVPQKSDPLAEIILEAIRENPKVTRAYMASKAGVNVKTIARKLKEMACVRFVGSSKAGHWEIIS